MLPRCFRRAFASRGGWQPPSKRPAAPKKVEPQQQSLDEPVTPRPTPNKGFRDTFKDVRRLSEERMRAGPINGFRDKWKEASRIVDQVVADRSFKSFRDFRDAWKEVSRRSEERRWSGDGRPSTNKTAEYLFLGASAIISWAVVHYFVSIDRLSGNMNRDEQDGERKRMLANMFTSYALVEKQPVSSTMSIFHLRPGNNSKHLEVFQEAWKTGIWNVLFKQPQIQVVRAYTPLPPHSDQEARQDLRFLIRYDQRGEVSSWLHRLPAGNNIDMKGPNLEFQIPPAPQHITFLAGGTGIATALQAANALLNRDPVNNAPDSPQITPSTIHILWATRQREDCKGGISDQSIPSAYSIKSSASSFIGRSQPTETPQSSVGKGLIVQELDALKKKFPNQVSVDYFVDEEGTWITTDAVFKSISAHPLLISSETSQSAEHRVFISGPDGFIDHFAGPKVWQYGRQEQGQVSGVVAEAVAKANTPVTVTKV